MESITLSAKEACKFLGISYWSLLERAKRGEIPHSRIGKKVLFRPASLLTWIENEENSSLQKSKYNNSGR